MNTSIDKTNSNSAGRNYRIVILALAVICLVGCSSSNGCNGCGYCTSFNPFAWVCKLLRAHWPNCGDYCSVRIELVDENSPNTRINNVKAGSKLDITVTGGLTDYFDGEVTVQSDGTITVPLNPCADPCDATGGPLDRFRVTIWEGSIKTQDASCPSGQCRQWTKGSGVTLASNDNCVPVFRVGMKKRATCAPC